MRSEFGKNIRISIFGESHGPSVGAVVTGLPAGEPVDMEALQRFLDRRAPGRSLLTTARKETDVPRVISGISDGKTTGGPLCVDFMNSDAHSTDYESLKNIPRPGHADYTARLRYGDDVDLRGGGHFSGRLTAPLCAAGGIALQILERKGIRIGAHLKQVGAQKDRSFDPVKVGAEDFAQILKNELPVLDAAAGEAMKQEILTAKAEEDSVGAAVECAVTGLPGGLGSPMFEGVENVLAQALFGIPAIKAVEFGAGTGYADLRGSRANDAFCIEDGEVRTVTNNCGGILGGITNGMPLVFTVTFKPTPSIGKLQHSVDLSTMEETELRITGRHDPCIALRAVPAVEAAAALCVLDMMAEREENLHRAESQNDGDLGSEEILRRCAPQDDSKCVTLNADPVIPNNNSVILSEAKDPQDSTPAALEDLRTRIDAINTEMLELFRQRMEVSARIAACKKQTGRAVNDPAREAQILEKIGAQAGPELESYARRLFETLFELSKDFQRESMAEDTEMDCAGEPDAKDNTQTSSSQKPEGDRS